MNSPRQLVLLCDGTNNNLSGRQADTHVVLLAELLRLFPDPRRLVYYDPGVGNPGQLPGTTFADKLGRARDRINGLAFGRGLYDNVAEGYRFLMAHWRPGDQIFLFGFSRGAFTARSIGGMVNAFGIIDSHQDTLVSSLVATYFSRPSASQAAIREQAARLFGQAGAGQAWPEVHFVGVWDTVASVGLPPFGLKITARPTLAGKHFRHVRQALALDEQRAQFLPRAYAQDDGGFAMAGGQGGDIRQCWFRGSHCDVGGGNAYPYSELSRAPFAWLVAEAVQCGLALPATPAHAAPATEDDVLRLMPMLDPRPPERHAARINSETCATPLWALTGLKVRDTAHAAVDDGERLPVRMAAHPSVAAWAHAFPAATAWGSPATAASWLRLAVGLLLLVALFVLTGWLQFGHDDLRPLPAQLASAFDANLAFQRWQLDLRVPVADWTAQARRFARPGLALLVDLALIATWAALLAPWFCRAFARHAGLIQLGQTPPAWLNRAGWALAAAVGADLLEGLLSLLALALAGGPGDLPPPALAVWALRLPLAAASLAKWSALAAVALLILSSWLRHHRGAAPSASQPGRLSSR
jgi:hypothetical protein